MNPGTAEHNWKKLTQKQKKLLTKLNDNAAALHIHGMITNAEREKITARLCKERDRLAKENKCH